MKNRIVWALVALNVLLAVTLAARWGGENTAMAQVRRPADYVMINGEISGGSSAVVYMIDTTNGLLGAMVYDDSNKQLNTMPPIDLARVFETGPAGGAGRVPAPVPGARR
jgi:hypothetical protein